MLCSWRSSALSRSGEREGERRERGRNGGLDKSGQLGHGRNVCRERAEEGEEKQLCHFFVLPRNGTEKGEREDDSTGGAGVAGESRAEGASEWWAPHAARANFERLTSSPTWRHVSIAEWWVKPTAYMAGKRKGKGGKIEQNGGKSRGGLGFFFLNLAGSGNQAHP